jgi:NAD(P)-dependent dehydrogenase (short-subunit alcohol dehydrogenase family)
MRDRDREMGHEASLEADSRAGDRHYRREFRHRPGHRLQGRRDGRGRAEYVVADVGEQADVELAAAEAERHFGGFDTWVNNAGVGVFSTLEEISDEDHERLFRTNYWGVVHGSRVALKLLKRRGGALINMDSIAAEMPAPMHGAYAAAKHAVKGITDSLRIELLHEGAPVSVTLIQPAGIDTPFAEHARTYTPEASQIPPPTSAPELVADAVLHAAQYPTRDVIVGGTGRAMVTLAHLLPPVADRHFSRTMTRAVRQPGRPRRATPASLHRPGRDGQRYGDQGHQFDRSLTTAARLHPGTMLGLLAAGVAAAALLAPRRSGRGLPPGAWR